MNLSPTTLVPANQSPNLDTLPRADLAVIFDGFKAQFDSLVQTAQTLTVTDASQTATIKLAHITRMSLRAIRLDIEKKRKEPCAKWLRDQIEPLELRLDQPAGVHTMSDRLLILALWIVSAFVAVVYLALRCCYEFSKHQIL